MKIIYRLIMITILLMLPAYGATLSDFNDIVKLASPVCVDHKVICTFNIVQNKLPLAYTRYNNITLSTTAIDVLTRDELRSVMFHEVAHAVLRHSDLSLQYYLSIYDKGRQLTQEEIKTFRHKIELDADTYSTILLYQYGYRSEIPKALEKFNSDNNKESITHPSNKSRAENIRNLQRILK